MTSQASTDFAVKFSTQVARVIDCEDSNGLIQFTLDGGSKGDKSICLEHHSVDAPRSERYHLAFRRAKEFLESCGFEVEIYGNA
jgi:hypothetical protein